MRRFSLNVVLVRTLYPRNIGATSRAMANMGAQRLILIGPQCAVDYDAQQAAATGQEALQNRTTYNSWNEFFDNEDEGLRISFTARDGKGRQVRDLDEALRWMQKEHPFFQEETDDVLPVYLIFGPEDAGLAAEDLDYTHFACCLPTFGKNPSLNLAQATLIALLMTRLAWGGERTEIQVRATKRNSRPSVDLAEKSLKTWVEEMGFGVDDRHVSAYTILKRLLFHNVPTQKEIKMVETVFQQGIRKLREYNDMRKQMGLPFVRGSDPDQTDE